METRDLPSYIPGQDQYCERNKNDPNDNNEKLEEQLENYKNLVSDIKYTLTEKTTMIERFKIINALIEDFKEN